LKVVCKTSHIATKVLEWSSQLAGNKPA